MHAALFVPPGTRKEEAREGGGGGGGGGGSALFEIGNERDLNFLSDAQKKSGEKVETRET